MVQQQEGSRRGFTLNSSGWSALGSPGTGGGRWSSEATDFVSQLAKAKASSEPFLCANAWSRRGGCDGLVSWLVQGRAPSLLPCWV